MIPARYLWKWEQPDEQLARRWSEQLGIPLLAARVLAARGWPEEEVRMLLAPAREGRLSDPMLMKGMAEAAGRIRRAIQNGERIRVYGDYDADGVTSTAIMIRLLTQLGANFDTYIPHRQLEGYGLNVQAIESAKEAGVSLIVTVDNGISAVEQIAYARELGMDVVVTDHHEPPFVLPEAAALVNPMQADCPYPFKRLCGAGVAFRLAEALLGRRPDEWADLAAIGTVADLMPLTGENRLIVRLGLERMRKNPSCGIRALCEVSGFAPEKLTSGRIGFAIAPRLNAGGRLERADGAVRLLVTEDPDEAMQLAKELDRLNAERQRLVEQTAEEAEKMWQEKKAQHGGFGPGVIVLSQAGWNAGIAGLVASRLLERHYRPAVVLAEDPETGLCKGSARSIEGFDIYEALTECAELLEHYGGHTAAAGMTVRAEKVGELEQRLHRIAMDRLRAEDWLPKKRADLVCSLEEVTLEAAEALMSLEPFGNGFPVPRMILDNVMVQESRVMGKDSQHIRITVSQAGRKLDAVGFGIGDLAARLGAGRNLSMIGELGVNEWNGNRKVQFMIQDLRCDEWLWVDRRGSGRVWEEIVELAKKYAGKLMVVCDSPDLADKLAGQPEMRGIETVSFAGIQELDFWKEAASAREAGSSFVFGGGDQPPLRVLALVGLPDNAADLQRLAGLMKAAPGWEEIYLFSGRQRRAAGEVPALGRDDFVRVYSLLREYGTWVDGPEGVLRQVSDRCGLPLAVVRQIQEVFEELGFIHSRGAERMLAANPPKRRLDESARYVRLMRQAEAASFPDWPLEKLKEWAERMRNDGHAAAQM
jgi:single-stranded-DNA-specific exonuclease